MAHSGAPVLTQRQLNRALLARQLLLERAALDVPTALERMGGLQAQYAPSMYIGLWSRLDGFQRSDLDQALEQRRVVQGTLLRVTIHLVSAADYWPMALAIRQSRRDWFLRVSRATGTPDEFAAAAEKLREALRAGPLRRAQIEELLAGAQVTGVGLWIDLLRVPPSGTWKRRRADLYHAAQEWLGPPPPELTADSGVDLLVRRYLSAFGPATRNELADWAGLPVATVVASLNRLVLCRFQAEDGAELLDLPDAPLPDPDTPAPVQFLPVWDATLLVHARRSGILPEQHRSKIFNTRTPHSVNTILVDGEVAGTWRYERGTIQWSEFSPLTASARRQLAEEADRLVALHA